MNGPAARVTMTSRANEDIAEITDSEDGGYLDYIDHSVQPTSHLNLWDTQAEVATQQAHDPVDDADISDNCNSGVLDSSEVGDDPQHPEMLLGAFDGNAADHSITGHAWGTSA